MSNETKHTPELNEVVLTPDSRFGTVTGLGVFVGEVRVTFPDGHHEDFKPTKLISKKLIASAPDLLKENQELKALSRELLTAIEQSQFFTDGFSQGSASISEVRNAYSEQHKAYSALWDYLKSKV